MKPGELIIAKNVRNLNQWIPSVITANNTEQTVRVLYLSDFSFGDLRLSQVKHFSSKDFTTFIGSKTDPKDEDYNFSYYLAHWLSYRIDKFDANFAKQLHILREAKLNDSLSQLLKSTQSTVVKTIITLIMDQRKKPRRLAGDDLKHIQTYLPQQLDEDVQTIEDLTKQNNKISGDLEKAQEELKNVSDEAEILKKELKIERKCKKRRASFELKYILFDEDEKFHLYADKIQKEKKKP